ncbi:MAG: cation transporter [FCB group bacterium]|nr:cation transporter [FCB group bacterium]
MSHHHHETNGEVSGIRLLITLILNLTITVAEIIGGLLSGSLSLISDALHNFSDGIAVVISYIAIRLKRKPKSAHFTFGIKRAQIIAAIINAGVLVAISFYLLVESYNRFVSPQPIEARLMITVATIGLIANTVGTLLLRPGAKENMNIRSAYLHLLSDAVSSVGVILGGTAIYFWNITWVDPLLTVLISVYITRESYQILKAALEIVLMASPSHLSIKDINNALLTVKGVNNIHHVHLWQLDEQDIHFEAHLDVADRLVSETKPLLETTGEILHDRFGINHVTIQFECDSCDEKELLHS